MARELFGTDGIRGVAGGYPLDPPTVFSAGVALGRWAAGQGPVPELVIGTDPRESSQWIGETVAAGLASAGVGVRFAGLIPTPGVAYLTRTGPFVAGVMISASHNQFQDNGIKVFTHTGFKLADREEEGLEQEILRLREAGMTASRQPLEIDESLGARYADYLATTIGASLRGLRIVVDCGHGAASYLAPRLFERLGGRVDAIGCAPDGRNINFECGSLYPATLRAEVQARGADLGVAFDGDADRAVIVSRGGKTIDGDSVMLICARHWQDCGRLPNSNGAPVVVATVMSNLGLEKALEARGIRLVRTPVGDKYVLEEMLRRGAVLGGEQSGHIIFREYATTGDGLLTALRVLEIVRQSGKDLDTLASSFEIYPQRLLNVPVREKKPLEEMGSVRREIRAVEQALGGHGRVLVRFSGTEPLARVMVEGRDGATVNAYAERIAGAIRVALGT